MRLAVWFAAITAAPTGAGCDAVFGLDHRAVDAPVGIDADPDAPDSAWCPGDWNPRRIDLCALGVPPSQVAFTASGQYRLDTDATTLVDPMGIAVAATIIPRTQAGGPEIAILYVTALNLPATATLRVFGSRAFVVAATGAINLAGTIDAGSKFVAAVREDGPGATACFTGGIAGTDAGTHGAGGGGGGGFGAAGGAGGAGQDTTGPRPGGAGGPPLTVPVLRGGCPGGTGGSGVTMNRAQGGAGGGAVHLAARSAVTIAGGRVFAGGGGGDGARASQAGGAGGGSGGMIELDAPLIQVNGVLVAQGGGGGEGGDGTACVGKRGEDSADAAAAAGGTSASALPPFPPCGAAGGDGSLGGAGAVGFAGVTVNNGGGGGGGGAGIVDLCTGGPVLQIGGLAVISPAYGCPP